jgi:hypothetical protein
MQSLVIVLACDAGLAGNDQLPATDAHPHWKRPL